MPIFDICSDDAEGEGESGWKWIVKLVKLRQKIDIRTPLLSSRPQYYKESESTIEKFARLVLIYSNSLMAVEVKV